MLGTAMNKRVVLHHLGEKPDLVIHRILEETGILSLIDRNTRVAIKPNLTYPYYKKGVTTSPEVIRETVRVLKDYTPHLAIGESDGGYGVWQAMEAFQGHGLVEMAKEMGFQIVNLSTEAREPVQFESRGRLFSVPLPCFLLQETDLLMTMPVPKVHVMTGLSLSLKNQWGCIPDAMRLRYHHLFNEAILAVNKVLKPVVLADGTFFLDRSGPMDGEPVLMDVLAGATDCGAFDHFMALMMGFEPAGILHFKRAMALGLMPRTLDQIDFNIHPDEARTHRFVLQRTLRNWIALAGFKYRSIGWFGYESWFGRTVLHGLLYLIAGKPVKPKP